MQTTLFFLFFFNNFSLVSPQKYDVIWQVFWHQKKTFFALSLLLLRSHTHTNTNTRSVWREKKFFNTSNFFFSIRLFCVTCCYIAAVFCLVSFQLDTSHSSWLCETEQNTNFATTWEFTFSIWAKIFRLNYIFFFLWLLIFQFFSYTLSTHASNTVSILTYMCIYQMHRIVVVAVVVVVFFDWYKFRSKKAHKRSKEKKKIYFCPFFYCSSSSQNTRMKMLFTQMMYAFKRTFQ